MHPRPNFLRPDARGYIDAGRLEAEAAGVSAGLAGAFLDKSGFLKFKSRM